MGIVKAFFLALAAKLAADETKAWLPLISEHLLQIAVLRLPETQRERYREEWAADLASYPGEVSRTFRAIGLLVASWRIASSAAARLTSAIHNTSKFLRLGPTFIRAVFHPLVDFFMLFRPRARSFLISAVSLTCIFTFIGVRAIEQRMSRPARTIEEAVGILVSGIALPLLSNRLGAIVRRIRAMRLAEQRKD